MKSGEGREGRGGESRGVLNEVEEKVRVGRVVEGEGEQQDFFPVGVGGDGDRFLVVGVEEVGSAGEQHEDCFGDDDGEQHEEEDEEVEVGGKNLDEEDSFEEDDAEDEEEDEGEALETT